LRPVLSTQLFRTVTAASAQRAWDELTSGAKRSWLYGLTLQCAPWRDGSIIRAEVPGGPRLRGEVLRAECPIRLSHTVGDTLEEPSVYLTWEISPEPMGTVVRLSVDEPDPSAVSETELTWLHVISALGDHLGSCGPTTRESLV
jgi:hypothetical protein